MGRNGGKDEGKENRERQIYGGGRGERRFVETRRRSGIVDLWK
jgi:hypothetical protein